MAAESLYPCGLSGFSRPDSAWLSEAGFRRLLPVCCPSGDGLRPSPPKRFWRPPASGVVAMVVGPEGRGEPRPSVSESPSAHRLEVVVRHVLGDVPAEQLRLHVGGAEVQAGPDARLDDLRERL